MTSPISIVMVGGKLRGPAGLSPAPPWAAGTYAKRTFLTHNHKIWFALKQTALEPTTANSADWMMFYDFTQLLAVVGVVTGSVSAHGLRKALAQQGKYDDFLNATDGLSADPANTARIQWDTAFPVSPNDPLWTNIKAGLDYSNAQMATLMALALTLGPA